MAGKRVLVAMSGGVDSSVCAYLLLRAGYECEGATMRLTCSRSFDDAGPRSCCSLADIADAQAVCARLGIPHRVLDMRELFERRVVDKFVATYEDGRTPNPCIDCNRYMKFGALLDYALEQGFDYIATGHYAQVGELGDGLITDGGTPAGDADLSRIEPEALLRRIAALAGGDAGADGRASEAPVRTLSLGVDASKDQSYVLYALTQERLAHVLLPLGGLMKERDVRSIAAEQGFVNAGKRDSQGICFVPDGDFASYIERRRGALLPEGDIVDERGTVLGRHQGALRYTVGQRKGLGVALLHPVYVTRVDVRANTVVLGENEDLMARALVADDWIWSAPAGAMRALLNAAGPEGIAVTAKIRYHQPAQAAWLSWDDTRCAGAVAGAVTDGAGTVSHGFDEVPGAAIAMPDGMGAIASDAEASGISRHGTDDGRTAMLAPAGVGYGADALSEGDEASEAARNPSHNARRLRVTFAERQRAIAPGQAVVVYAGDVVLGGGTTRAAIR